MIQIDTGTSNWQHYGQRFHRLLGAGGLLNIFQKVHQALEGPVVETFINADRLSERVVDCHEASMDLTEWRV